MKDLTQGSITKIIIVMAAPVTLGMLFQTLYLLVDLYFVARLGDASIAGVGAAGTLFFMIMAFSQVLGVSAVALISQAVGRKDKDEANLVFNQSMLLSVACAAATIIGGYTLVDNYLQSIVSDNAVRSEGLKYLYWFLPGMSLQFAMMTMSSALRGTGIVKPAMAVQVLAVILNTILTPILIIGPGPIPAMGVVGAGLSSSLSIIIGVIMLVMYFIKLEKYVSFQKRLWRPDFALWKRIIDIGLPAGGEMLLLFVYFSVVYWVIKDFGASAQAGFSIGGRIMQSIFMPAMVISFVVGPIAGQNYGAGHADRVRKTLSSGVILSSLIMILVTIFLQWKPELLVAFFTDEPDVIEVGAVFLSIISWNFVAQGIVFTCSGIFQGLGNTRPALFSSIVRLGIFIPIAVYLTYQESFTINQLWYVSVATVIIQAIVSFFLLRREFHYRLKNLKEPQAENVTETDVEATAAAS
ncbi:MATE family efflux transporter [Gammaproteobacteria bacterium]|nr:MATE family efflux transporter [Gammaproteobacteria bacterium]